jgi:hypothetical protein
MSSHIVCVKRFYESEAVLKTLFSLAGPVLDASMLPNGFATVTYRHAASMHCAIRQFNNLQFLNKTLYVSRK